MDAPHPTFAHALPVAVRPLGRGRFTRAHRVLLLLVAVWVLHTFDLKFTMAESTQSHFVELNPIAARLIGGPEVSLVVYKLGLLGFGTAILIYLRRHSVAELGCWFLLSASFYVGARWFVYYECLATGSSSIFFGP
jgi:hypothetical protein